MADLKRKQLKEFLSGSFGITGSLNVTGSIEFDKDISGSITSTGSFGRINAADKVFVDGRLGIGTELPAREFNFYVLCF